MATPEVDNRITFTFDEKTKESIQDVSMILGIKPSELVTRAVSKYVEAIEKQVGPPFQAAMEGIRAVRKISG